MSHRYAVVLAAGKGNVIGLKVIRDLEDVLGTVGEPYPGIELRLDDRTGEILTRHPGVFKGYWNKPDKTAETFTEDGWLKTGDVGEWVDGTHVKIVDRMKDMITSGGENIYPVEIENVMIRHPKVSKVQVVGVPDHRMGEVGMACVQLKPESSCTEEELIDFAKDKMANFKVPRYVKFVEDFPMTITGKVQKFEMRRIMRELLDLQEQETA